MGLQSGWYCARRVGLAALTLFCGQGGESPRLPDPGSQPRGVRGGVCCPSGYSAEN